MASQTAWICSCVACAFMTTNMAGLLELSVYLTAAAKGNCLAVANFTGRPIGCRYGPFSHLGCVADAADCGIAGSAGRELRFLGRNARTGQRYGVQRGRAGAGRRPVCDGGLAGGSTLLSALSAGAFLSAGKRQNALWNRAFALLPRLFSAGYASSYLILFTAFLPSRIAVR